MGLVSSPLEKVDRAQRETDEVPGLASQSVNGTLNGRTTAWLLPEEVPVALQINSTPYAVMMATPADLEDFAIGFVLSEGLVKHASYVANVLVMPSGEGFTADIAIDEENIIRERMVSRSLEGRVGCGLCGIEEMADVIRMPQHKLNAVQLDPKAVAKAFNELPEHQPMNAVNRTVHAAAWCSAERRYPIGAGRCGTAQCAGQIHWRHGTGADFTETWVRFDVVALFL